MRGVYIYIYCMSQNEARKTTRASRAVLDGIMGG